MDRLGVTTRFQFGYRPAHEYPAFVTGPAAGRGGAAGEPQDVLGPVKRIS